MAVRILHAHSTFSLGGKEARAVRLMNAFGDAAEHCIISGMPGELSARAAIDPGVAVEFPTDAPSLTGRPNPLRYLRLARYLRRFDLILTYNWGAMDVVAARRLFGGPPLIHHEDGFNEDEAKARNPIRNRFRRWALLTAYRLVVPSRTLEGIASIEWRPIGKRTERIPNGIDVGRYQQPAIVPIAGLERRNGEIIVGTIAGLRAVKNLPRLVRAFAVAAPHNARLVMVGEGAERPRIEAEARALGILDRLIMPGFMSDPAQWIGNFDVFALSSDSEQFPISVVEAMASGLPVASTNVGDIREMVSKANSFAIGGELELREGLARFISDPALRRHVGESNRHRAQSRFNEATMISRYARLYGEAIGAPHAFGAPAI